MNDLQLLDKSEKFEKNFDWLTLRSKSRVFIINSIIQIRGASYAKAATEADSAEREGTAGKEDSARRDCDVGSAAESVQGYEEASKKIVRDNAVLSQHCGCSRYKPMEPLICIMQSPLKMPHLPPEVDCSDQRF